MSFGRCSRGCYDDIFNDFIGDWFVGKVLNGVLVVYKLIIFLVVVEYFCFGVLYVFVVDKIMFCCWYFGRICVDFLNFVVKVDIIW